MIVYIILGVALSISLITDIKDRRILNIVTLPVITFAFMYYTLVGGWNGFLYSGQGFIVGFSLLLIPYILGGMGAGDVKLMAAIGALMGTSFVFQSFIYTALIGGAISLFIIVKQNGFWNPLKNLLFNVTFLKGNLGSLVINKEDKSTRITFPYGVAIVLGTVCNLLWGGL